MLSFCKLGRLCLNYIFNRWRHVVPLTSTRRSLVPFKGIFSGEKFNYDVMLGAEMAFSPWNKGLFRNVLVTATQGNQVYCFHPIRQSQCVINLFYSHPCACHSAIRFRDAGIITFQQHDTVFAVWKWHTIITRPGTEIARARQSIPYRKRVESFSVSQSVTLSCVRQEEPRDLPCHRQVEPRHHCLCE